MTGLDFSPAALAVARDLFTRAGSTGRFVESEVYDATTALAGEAFDLVYTGVGALNWLPDVRGWAEVVAALLSPGGRLFLRDGHPMLYTLDDERDDDLLLVTYPYVETAEPQRWETPTSYLGEGELAHPVIYQWNHGIGELITAVLDAGLQLTGFTEHLEIEWQALPTMVTDDGRYVLPEGRERLPLMYTLQAVRPG